MINSFLSIYLIFNFAIHEHYTTITNINFSPEKNIEIVMEFTAHDLEYHFEKEYHKELKLGSINELKDSDSLIFEYISNHFYIKLNNSKITLSYLGKEVNNDESLLIFLEKKSFKNIKSLEIINDLLCKHFPNQQNIVHLEGNLKNSFIFNSKETIHKFK